MKKTKLLWPSLLAGLLALSSGCATRALWKTAPLDAYNEPDDLPALRLFEAGPSNDVLVVYREYSERHDYTRTRAYLLNQNRRQLAERRQPRFVGTNLLSGTRPLPMLCETNPPPAEWPAKPYALVSANQQSFRLVSPDGQTDPFELPVYNDGRGRWYRIALTPVTVVADITIVGGVIGYFWLHGMAESGGSVPVD